MTRPLALTALAASLLWAPSALAGAKHRTAGSTGIGLGGGTTGGGISAKHFLSEGTAVQGVVGLAGFEGDGLQLNADYLMEQPVIASAEPFDVAWNFGVGAGVALFPEHNLLGLGVSGIAGVEFAFVPIPLDLVLEYRPTLGVLPGVGLDLVNFSGHLRWFF
mgnify:FL=1